MEEGDYDFFRVAFICVFSALSILRIYFRIRAGLLREPLYSKKEPIGFILFRSLVGIPLLLAVIAYCFLPGRYDWCYFPLPTGARAPGIPLSLFSLLLLFWAHRTLGRNFSTGVAPKNDHRIIRKGPYALIRHPMYLAYFLLFIAAFLISQNWLIGATGLAIIGMLMTVRRIREERLLAERFGDDYRSYRENTGGFIPRIKRPSSGRSE
jgi:protein-S-isoprenylcysteine O-methyltransferase Ste14